MDLGCMKRIDERKRVIEIEISWKFDYIDFMIMLIVLNKLIVLIKWFLLIKWVKTMYIKVR
jgi:hypothetical protein